MSVTQHPLHRSVRAGLPHTAPASGRDDQTLVRVGVADGGCGQPMRNQAMHSTPWQVMGLAAAAQGAMPQPPNLDAEYAQPRPVVGHAEVTAMAGHHRAQVLALLFDGSVHAPPELQLDRLQFGSQAFGTSQPQYHELSLPGFPAAMREAQEVEGLRLALSPAASVVAGEAPELDQPRLVRVQLQPELAQPLGHRALKALGIPPELESGHPIVGVAHDDHVASGMAPPPLIHPQVERVVQVDVGQQRADAPALDRPQLTLRDPTFFQHARVQPFLDQPHHTRVSHAVLDELDQPVVLDRVEELGYVRIEYPVHSLGPHPYAHGIQRVVRAAPRPEAVAEPEEVLLVDGVQDFDRGALDDLVLQRGHAQGALAAVGFVDVHPLDRLGPVAPSGQPVGQLQQIALQVPPVRLPGLAVHPGSRVALERKVGRLKAFDRVDVVQQSGELRTTAASCRLSYAIERGSHVVCPHRSAGHARRDGISLGPPPSLHHLRHLGSCTRSFVRQLLRYYAAVRLPTPVAHRRTPLGFTMRSAFVASQRDAEGRGISRFPSKVFPRVRGVCDRAGSGAASPMRQRRCGLRLISTASAPRTSRTKRCGACITRLNTRPARPPVNASPTPLRLLTHDSGPPWLAKPSTYDSFIHNTLPVLTGARRKTC